MHKEKQHKSVEKFEDICELKKSIMRYVIGEISSGFDCDTTTVSILGEYVDMIKDLAEAEKYCHEACYYESVVEAMDNSEDYGYRMGYNPNRNSMGQYSDGRGRNSSDYNRSGSYSGSRNSSQSGNDRRGYRPYDDSADYRMMPDDEWDDRYGRSFNQFRKAKRHYTQTHSTEDKDLMKIHANEHLEETMSTFKEIWENSDPELRKRMKADMTKFVNEMSV